MMNRRSAASIFLLACLSLWGCQGYTGALDDLAQPFKVMTPEQAARDAFNPYDADLRRKAVSMLSAAEFGGEAPYVKTYRLLVDDPDPTVRAACIKALGMHGEVEDAQLIVRRMGDDSELVRWEAAKALQKIHNPIAIKPLINAVVKDLDADVRMASAFALGQYAEPAVFEALVAGLNDTEFGVVKSSQHSLKTLTGYDFGTDASMWLIWARRNEGNLFRRQLVYTWKPFYRPDGFVDKLKFWERRKPDPDQIPTGLGDNPQLPSS